MGTNLSGGDSGLEALIGAISASPLTPTPLPQRQSTKEASLQVKATSGGSLTSLTTIARNCQKSVALVLKICPEATTQPLLLSGISKMGAKHDHLLHLLQLPLLGG